ncbi:MAG: SDR family oxidoreductase [Candidatus Eremiobacteraeota bacterium]|nr:SDR family oxidoreductase [Candidatus Eremiobacteraeota bacterium]
MRVSIFGATGGIGRWLLAIARENGDNVKILVRDRRKLPRDLGAIGVIEGDALDAGAVEATVGGTDVVFSALGSDGLGPTTLFSRGTANIIAAMHKAGATRLLAVSSAGVDDDPNMNFFSRRIFLPLVLRNVLADLRIMEREIEASGLIYTIVRPGRLTDGPRTGLYRANDRMIPENGREIARADVADFMHRVVIDERTLKKIVGLTY